MAAVTVLHVALAMFLIRAFTPDLAASVVRSVVATFAVPAPKPTAPLDRPKAEASAKAATVRKEGAAGAPGRHASPRPVAVPTAPVVVHPPPAPPLAGEGAADTAGAAVQGPAFGAGGSGAGTGSGIGSGQGGGGGAKAAPVVKIGGDISSAKDYPRTSRDLRIGASVTIDLAVDPQGRVSGCKVVQASPDPAADRVTCDLAMRRFRFLPARDESGRPVAAVFRWRQRWFY